MVPVVNSFTFVISVLVPQIFTPHTQDGRGFGVCIFVGVIFCVLIREFVGIYNVVTNLMRDTNYLGYFVALNY